MALSNNELRDFLYILGIKVDDDFESVKLRDATKAFQDLALVLHPDKAGPGSTAAFQKLRNAYERVREHFKQQHVSKEEVVIADEEDQRFFDDNFHAFNFPYENQGSFTVNIEDSLADTWQECITLLLGEPKVVVNSHGTECDRHWKVSYGNERRIDITIHIYNNPKNKKGSKLMLQGSIQSLICAYVFNELPRIYKHVRLTKPKPLEDKQKKKQSTPGKAMVKCDQCRFKSTMLQMKMHIKNIHSKKPTRASKRLPVCTPGSKPPKRSKPESTSRAKVVGFSI